MKRISSLALGLTLLISSSVEGQDSNGRFYSAGEVQSKAELQYGRFEAMLYSSDVSGTTSTFFLWKSGGEGPDARWNEIDVETFGKDPLTWQSNPIWEYDDADTDTKRWEGLHSDIEIAKTWVKFTMEWTPEYIAWFNDDVEVRRIVLGEEVPEEHHRYNGGDSDDPVAYIADPMRVAFNHWATYPGEWLGPFDPADLPSYQFVDWFTYQPWEGEGFGEVELRVDFESMEEVEAAFSVSTHTFGENQCTFNPLNVGVVDGMLWLAITGYDSSRPPQGEEIPGH